MKLNANLIAIMCSVNSIFAWGSGWNPSPSDVPNSHIAKLSDDEFYFLSKFLVYSPAEFIDSNNFTRGLTLEPITIKSVEPTVNGNEVEFDSKKYELAKKALAELEAVSSVPLALAHGQQEKVVRFFEIMLNTETEASKKKDILQKLENAKIQLKQLADQIGSTSQSPLQLAILRRAHRSLLNSGFEVPPIEIFAKEWPQWVASFLNQDFLHFKLRLNAGLSGNSINLLEQLKPRLNNFEFIPGHFVTLRPIPPTQLSDIELTQKSSIIQENGEFVVVLSLTYAGVASLFGSSLAKTILPISFAGTAEAEGNFINFSSFSTNLCIESSRLTNGTFKLFPCKETSL